MTNEVYGLVAAALAAISFGTYGVPMKGEAATRVDVDPLVFQTYKACTVLASSYALVLLNIIPRDWSFTYWGFVSAAFWVPGGTAGVYAIRKAGLAISVGLWSSVIVLLSFFWGVVIFEEKQRSKIGAAGASIVLCVGLWGIAYFSSPDHNGQREATQSSQHKSHTCQQVEAGETTTLLNKPKQTNPNATNGFNIANGDGETTNPEFEGLDLDHFPHSGAPPCCEEEYGVSFMGLHIQKYHLGLIMAVMNGVFAAFIMIPLHYAPKESTKGLNFSMSFGIAAVIVVFLCWMLRLGFNALRLQSVSKAYAGLPSFHFLIMWKAGILSGLLYSMGSLCGIVSINNLGNFMGYSLNQMSMIISGFWGIFYYKEITGTRRIVGFLSSAGIIILGILWLGFEHMK